MRNGVVHGCPGKASWASVVRCNWLIFRFFIHLISCHKWQLINWIEQYIATIRATCCIGYSRSWHDGPTMPEIRGSTNRLSGRVDPRTVWAGRPTDGLGGSTHGRFGRVGQRTVLAALSTSPSTHYRMRFLIDYQMRVYKSRKISGGSDCCPIRPYAPSLTRPTGLTPSVRPTVRPFDQPSVRRTSGHIRSAAMYWRLSAYTSAESASNRSNTRWIDLIFDII